MNNNHACIVCMGSNKDGEFHLKNAQQALVTLFDEVKLGAPVLTEAEGSLQQPDYLNQAACFHTELDAQEVIRLLKQIETSNGRTPHDKYTGIVPLDLDLLKYDDRILKPADLKKKYVQQALRTLS